MQYLEIRNWRNFQHYKDRNPPWIKLHYEILTSPDWVMIDDASKLLAVVCMMLASRNEGRVLADEEYIQKVAHLAKKPDLNPLIKSGFFVDASIMLADASTKTETETYRKEAETDYRDGFFIFYNSYPKKVAPKDAEKSYQRALKSADHATIMAGLQRYKQSVASTERRFIQAPAAWLNKGRWADDYGPAASDIPDWIKAQR